MSPAEKDMKEIKSDIASLKKQGKRGEVYDIIQVVAIALLFFWGIERIGDLKRVLK